MTNVENVEKQLLELLTHSHGVVTLLQKEAEKDKRIPTAESVKDPVRAVPELEVVNNVNLERRGDKSTLGSMGPDFNGVITTVESENPPNLTKNEYDFSFKEPYKNPSY